MLSDSPDVSTPTTSVSNITQIGVPLAEYLRDFKSNLAMKCPGALIFFDAISRSHDVTMRLMVEISSLVAQANPAIAINPEGELANPEMSPELASTLEEYGVQLAPGLLIEDSAGVKRISAVMTVNLLGAVSFGNSIYETNFLKGDEATPALLEAGLAQESDGLIRYNLPKMLSVFSI